METLEELENNWRQASAKVYELKHAKRWWNGRWGQLQEATKKSNDAFHKFMAKMKEVELEDYKKFIRKKGGLPFSN